MPNPIIYEVAPGAEDGWIVRLPGDSLSEGFENKVEAITRARQLAARHQGGVRVLTSNGHIEVEYAPPVPGART
jgi:hypothetical protein